MPGALLEVVRNRVLSLTGSKHQRRIEEVNEETLTKLASDFDGSDTLEQILKDI